MSDLLSRRQLLTALGLAGAACATGVSIQHIHAVGNSVSHDVYGSPFSAIEALEEAVLERVVALDSIVDLVGFSGEYDGQQVHLAGYAPVQPSIPCGYRWKADQPKFVHNGVSIISPTVPLAPDLSDYAAYLQRTGETDPSGDGCWVLLDKVADVRGTAQLLVRTNDDWMFGPGETQLTTEILAKGSAYSLGAKLSQTAQDMKIFYYAGVPAPMYRTVLGFRMSQPDSTLPGGGTANNHSSLKFSGGSFNRALLNQVDSAALGISFGYGAISLPKRRHEHGLAAFNSFRNMEKMAIENIGASYSVLVGNSVDGIRGNSHGIRLTGYALPSDSTEAPCVGVVGAANVICGMLSGVSLQNTSRGFNLSALYMEDVQYGIHAIRGTAQANNPTLGRLDFAAKQVGRGIYSQGASHTTYDFTLDGTTVGAGIEEITESTAQGRNVYRGVMKGTASTGATIRYSYQVLDLLIDEPAQSGCVLSGSFCRGGITVTGAGSNGVAIYGSSNKLDVVAANCSAYALVIDGHHNVIDCSIEGNVLLRGNGNQMRGSINGTVTDQGSGNDKRGLYGYSASGVYTGTTDADGEIVVPLGLKPPAGAVSAVAVLENSTLTCTCLLKSAPNPQQATFIIANNGVAAPHLAVSLRWMAEVL